MQRFSYYGALAAALAADDTLTGYDVRELRMPDDREPRSEAAANLALAPEHISTDPRNRRGARA